MESRSYDTSLPLVNGPLGKQHGSQANNVAQDCAEDRGFLKLVAVRAEKIAYKIRFAKHDLHPWPADTEGQHVLARRKLEEVKNSAALPFLAPHECNASTCRPPTYDDLGTLSQLGWVINESLRLYPPGVAVGRFGGLKCVLGYGLPHSTLAVCAAKRDITLSPSTSKFGARPLHIKAGCEVVVSISHLHRDPRFWDAPHEFRPERFRDGIGAACRHPLCGFVLRRS